MTSAAIKFSLVLALCVFGASRATQAETPRQRMEEARAQLEAALAQQSNGVEPLPGERLGTVHKQRSRLSDAYFARQKALADQVARSRAAFDEARQALATAGNAGD